MADFFTNKWMKTGALLSAQLLGQTAPPVSLPQGFTPNNVVKQDNADTPETVNLKRDRALYGSETLLNALSNPARAEVSRHLLGQEDEQAKAWLSSSATFRNVARSIHLKDYIKPDGTLDDDLFDARAEAFTRKEVLRLAEAGVTFKDAMAQDIMVADHLVKSVPLVVGTQHPAVDYMLRNTKLHGTVSTKGDVYPTLFEIRLAHALSNQPLSELEKPELEFVRAAIENSARDVPVVKQMFDRERPYLRVPDSGVKVGDILGVGLNVDLNKAKNAIGALSKHAREFAQGFAQKAAGQGKSVYDYVTNPDDKTRAVTTMQLEEPLTKFVRESVTVADNILLDRSYLQSISNKRLPSEVRKSLEGAPLSTVLNTDGSINDGKMREVMIRPMKDLPLREMRPYTGFMEAVLGPEVTALITHGDWSGGAVNPEKIYISHDTTMGLFLTGGDQAVFENVRRNFVNDAYPDQERAADAIRPSGSNMPPFHRNPWENFQNKTNGDTEVPYSTNLDMNAPIQSATAVQGQQATNVSATAALIKERRVLTPQEEQIADYTAWRMGIGNGLKWQKTEQLPVVEGTSRGVLFYTANLENVRVDKRTAVGLAVGAWERDPYHKRIDTVIDSKASQDILTYTHEAAHAAGFFHPFSLVPNRDPLPGTVNKPDDYRVPGLTEDVTVMSYEGTSFKHLTPMLGDYLALGQTYGFRPVNEGNTTYTMQTGTQQDVVASRDTTKIWIDEKVPYAQTIVDTGGANTIDLTDGTKPVFLLKTVDLSHPTNDIEIHNGTKTKLSVMGTIDNAVVYAADVIGTVRPNVLEAKFGGTLDGRDGDDLLIGGVSSTVFVPGPGHDRMVVRVNAQYHNFADHVEGYNPKEDKIVAPAGAVKIEVEYYDRPIEEGDKARTSRLPETWVNFKDAQGETVKPLIINSETKLEGNLQIESVDGKILPVVKAPEEPLAKLRAIVADGGGLSHVEKIEKSAQPKGTRGPRQL